MTILNCKGCDEFVMELPDEEAEFLTAMCERCW
jgi:hypothetical protein